MVIDPDDWHYGDGTAPLVYSIYVSKKAYGYTTILKEFYMSRREPTSDTESLHYVWTDSVDLTKSKSYETERNDDGNQVFLFCGKEVYEKLDCGNTSATRDIVTGMLGWLAQGDRGDAGSVEVNGWYEAPTYCWSDPSCSDAGDGDITSAIVSLDAGLEDSFREDIDLYFKDISGLDAEALKTMDIDAIIEKCREVKGENKNWNISTKKVYNKFPKLLAEELYSELDGKDIL